MARTRRNKRLRKEREEKLCLNCGAALQGRFCHECGQENIEQKQSVGRLILDFLDGFIYFDSKFFKTLKPLLTKPGFLVNEYNSGKRNLHLTPVKLYFFLSFFYFFLSLNFGVGIDTNILELRERNDTAAANHPQESVFVYIYDSTTTLHTYDSTQSSLPKDKRDGVIQTWISRRVIKKVERGTHDKAMFNETLNKKFNSNLPQVVFLLMPFVALLLKLFYLKRKIYYIDHLVFSLNIHSFIFFLLSVSLFFTILFPSIGELVVTLGLLLILVYLYIALRKVYKGKVWLTITKMISLLILYLVTLGVGMGLAAAYTIIM